MVPDRGLKLEIFHLILISHINIYLLLEMFPHALHVLLVMDLENEYCKGEIVPEAFSC